MSPMRIGVAGSANESVNDWSTKNGAIENKILFLCEMRMCICVYVYMCM
jgi:hypothetical protein